MLVTRPAEKSVTGMFQVSTRSAAVEALAALDPDELTLTRALETLCPLQRPGRETS